MVPPDRHDDGGNERLIASLRGTPIWVVLPGEHHVVVDFFIHLILLKELPASERGAAVETTGLPSK